MIKKKVNQYPFEKGSTNKIIKAASFTNVEGSIWNAFFFTVNLILLSINLSADDHIKPEQGAFTSLYVSASDVDKYVSFLRKNSDAFKTIGSSDAGVCITRSGNQYPGQMMIWNAFPSVEAAMIGSLKYDPYKATGPISNLRNIKISKLSRVLLEGRVGRAGRAFCRARREDSARARRHGSSASA